MKQFEITITGRGGHGSRPDLAINPIDCFAGVYNMLSQLGGFQVTKVDGGKTGNVIPNAVTVWCGFAGDRAVLEQVLENTCSIYHCTGELREV